MNRRCVRIMLLEVVVLAAVAIAIFTPALQAAIVPLRSGTVISKADAEGFTYIKAVDDAGKEFWVLTTICTVGEKGKIAVLEGAHYDKLKTPNQGVIDDVYIGQMVRIGEVDVTGFGAHKLPAGCVQLE